MVKSYLLETLPPRWCMLSDDGCHQCFREGKRTDLYRDKKGAISEAWRIYKEDFSLEDLEDIAWMQQERDAVRDAARELRAKSKDLDGKWWEGDGDTPVSKVLVRQWMSSVQTLQKRMTKVESKCDELIEQGTRQLSSHGDGMVESAKAIKRIVKGEADDS